MNRAPGQPYRVLLIEDSRDDAELIAFALADGGLQADCQRAWSADTPREALRDAAPQLVLSDLNLPGFCAEEALQMVRAHDPRLPFVLLTGTPAIALPEPLPGTDGLLSKDDLQQLPDLVRQLLR